MTVLTVFNHGTGFNRHKGTERHELVATLHGLAAGVEARIAERELVTGDYIINEGPGSTSGGIALPTAVNPMTGGLRRDEQDKLGKTPGRARTQFAREFAGQHGGKQGALAGNISGAGWDENVQRTIQILQMLQFDAGRQIDVVNMVGWSRGGVTCMRIANAIHAVFGDAISMNIFAVDPVAGQNAGLTMDDTRDIPPTVRNYMAILSLHERRQTFKPQDMSRMRIADPARTSVTWLPMPGKHGEQVMGRSGVAGDASARVALSLAFAFLRHHGTQFAGPPGDAVTSDRSMAKAYARLQLHLGEFRDTAGFTNALIGLGLGRRDFAKTANMGAYVTGGKGSYWLNEHHRACFKAAFPDLYGTIFRSSARDGQLIPVMAGVGALGGPRTWLTRSLVARGYLIEQAPGRWAAQGGSGVMQKPAANRWPNGLPRHA